ncbi:MAG: hypothetical protein Fur0034_10820 [Desulfuromonadia bacterium]
MKRVHSLLPLIGLILLLLAQGAGGVQPSQTGQTSCFDSAGTTISCPDTGEDGDVRAGIAWPGERFTRRDDGTVTDRLTGLTWSADSATFGSMTWQEALDQIWTLNTLIPPHKGQSDWRLPTIAELSSLLDAGNPIPSRTLADAGFTLADGAPLWSSTTDPSQPDQGLTFTPDTGLFSPLPKGGSARLLPVRGPSVSPVAPLPRTGQTTCFSPAGATIDCSGTGQDGAIQSGSPWPTPRFTLQDQLVTDSLTGLVWTLDANPMLQFNASFDGDGIGRDGAVTWQHALDFIASLNAISFLGYQDWRLPNLNELVSLIDRGVPSSAEKLAAAGFINLPVSTDFYWSSTTLPSAPGQAYGVDLSTGAVNPVPKMATKNRPSDPGGLVWPMRGGVSGSSVLSILPTQIDFGTVTVGSGSTQRQLVISNGTTKTQPLVVGSLTISGTDQHLFTVSPGGSTPCDSLTPTLPPGTNCSLLVTFSPADRGDKSAIITLVTNAPGGTIAIPLLGRSVDGTPPTGTVTIDGGSVTTPRQEVTLSLSASDDSGMVTEMRFSNDGVTFSPWRTYASSTPWTLTPNDGIKTVHAQFRDAAGNLSPVVTGSIYLKSVFSGGGTLAGIPANGRSNARSLILTPLGIDIVSYRYAISPTSIPGATITPPQGALHPVATPIVLTDLPEGDYQIDLYGRDIAGTEQPLPTTATFTIDRTPPAVSITPSTLVSPTNIATPSIAGTVELGVREVSVSVNGVFRGYASVSGPTWTYTLGGLQEGENLIRVTAVDQAENSTTLERVIVYDTTPPTPHLSGTPAAGSSVNVNRAVITVDGADVVSYRFKLDGGDYSSEIPVSQPITIPSLSDGSHQVSVIGRDLAGNWQPQASATLYQWRVDTSPPTFTIAPPTSPTSASNQNITVSDISKNGTILSALNETTGFQSISLPVTAGSYTFSAFPLQTGTNRITVTAEDPAGNQTSSTLVIIRDQTPPVATVTGEITNGTVSPSPTARFTIGGDDVTRYLYRLDGGSFGTTPVDVAQPIILTGLSDGSHTLSVLGVDAAGNFQVTPTDITWIVDSTPPTVTLSGGPASFTSATTATFTVSGAVLYKYALDTGTYGGETDVNTPISLSGLSEGPHTLFVIGRDENGNWQKTPTTASWTIQTTPPLITITPLPSPTKSTKLSGTVQAGSTVSVRLQNLTDSTETTASGTVTGTSWSITLSAVSGKSYRATATALSPSGTTATTSIDFTFDNTPPTLSVTPVPIDLPTPSTPIGAQTALFLVSSNEPLEGYTWKLDTGGTSELSPPDRPIPLSSLSTGTHTLTVTGYDRAGNSSVKSLSWGVDTSLPAAVITPPSPFTNVSTLSLAVGGSGITTYRIRSADIPAGAVITPAVAVATPQGTPITIDPMPEGRYTLQIDGSVDGGASWQGYPTTLTWVVDRTRPTGITLSGVPSRSNATTLILTPSGTDLSTYQYKVVAAPPGYQLPPPEDTELPITTPLHFSTLPEGVYTIALIGRDLAGNWQVDPLTGWESDPLTTLVSFVIDRTAPVVTIAPPSSPTNTITQLLTGTVDDPSSTVTISSNTTATGGSASVAGGSWSFSLKGLVKGANLITVTARDGGGNTGTTSATITLSTDLPLAVLSATPPAVTNLTSASIAVTGTNGVVDYRYSLDGSPYGAVTPIASRIELTNLPEGRHTLWVIGRDIAGNWQESPTVVTWEVDTTPPVALVTPSTSPSPTNAVTSSFVVGGDDVVSYRYHLDASPDSPERSVTLPISLTNLSNGPHTLSVIGKDSAGNWQSAPTTITWTVETGHPLLTIDPPSFASPVTAPSVDLSGTVQSASSSVTIVSVSVTNNASNTTLVATVTGTTWSRSSLPLLEGTNPITVTSIDSAGNRTSIGFSVVRNTTPPNVQILSGSPPPQSTLRDVTLSVGGSDVKGYRYRLQMDGGTADWSPELPVSQKLSFTSLADGRYDLSLIGKDSAGNWQDTASPTLLTWTIDTVPPILAVDRVTTPTRLSSQRLTGTVEPGSTVTVANDRNSAGGSALVTGSTWSFTLNGLAAGENRITVTATDPAGNITTAVTTIYLETTPPTATLSGLPSGTTRETTATGIVTGEGIVSYSWSLDEGPFSPDLPVSQPLTISGLSDGVHTLAVLGKRGSGLSQSTPTTATWRVDTTPPVATLTGAPAGDTSQTSATVTVGGTDVVSYRYALDSSPLSNELPVELPISIPPLDEGDHLLSLYGKDTAGNWQIVPTTARWRVDTIPPSLTINPVLQRTTLTGQRISGSVESGATLSITIGSSGSVIPSRSGTSWSATISPLSMGENPIIVTAVDGAGNRSTQTVTIIRYTPPFVTLSNIPDGPINRVDLTMGVSGNGVVAYKYSLDGAPYQPETDITVPLQLRSLPEGVHTLRVIGRDSANSWQSQPTEGTITVDLTPPAGVDLAGAPHSPTNQRFISLTVSGGDVAFYSWSLDGGSWSEFVPVATPLSSVDLPDGPHRLQVIGKDLAGNIQQEPTTLLWSVDTIPPVTTPSRPGGVYGSAFDLTLTPSETATVRYTLDNTPPSDDSSLFTTPIRISRDTTVRFFALDPAGNREELRAETYSFAANGDVTGDGLIDIRDILRGLTLITGTVTVTEGERRRLDVAPLDAGMKPAPDGVIDIRDVIVVTRRAFGLIRW